MSGRLEVEFEVFMMKIGNYSDIERFWQ